MPDLTGARIDPTTGDIIFASTSAGTVITQASVPPSTAARAYVTTPVVATPQLTSLDTIAPGQNVTLTMLDANTCVINARGSVSQVTVYGDDGVVVTGSPITTSGTLRLFLADTGVVPGVYVNPNLTVDEKGRITLIANGTTIQTVAGRNFCGDGHLFAYADGSTLVFRALTAGPGVAISDAGNSVMISATVSNTSGSGGGYLAVSNGSMTANVVTSLAFPGSVMTVNGGLATLAYPQAIQSVGLQGTADIITSPSPITASGTLSVALANTGVAPGVYANPTLTIDAKGRIVSASTGAGPATTAPVAMKSQGTQISAVLASLDVTGNAATVTADTLGHVTLKINAPIAYAFQINYDSSGNIASVSNVPTGWTITISGSTLAIVHNLGTAAIPVFVSAFGFNGSFPGQYTQRIPVGTSSAAFSFTVTPNASAFTLYNATYNNTSAAVGGSTIIRILI